MNSQATLGLAVCALALGGCAVLRSSVETQRIESLREPSVTRTPGPVRGGAETSGGSVTVRAERPNVCERGTLVVGELVNTTTRTVQNMGTLSTLGLVGLTTAIVGGVFVVGGSGLLCNAECRTMMPTRLGDTETRVIGGVSVGVGLALTVPWIAALFAGSRSVERVPFRERLELTRMPCEPTPLASTQISLAGPGGFVLSRPLDNTGSVTIDLLDVLPTNALRGTSRWADLVLAVDRREVGRIRLNDAWRAAAERHWERVRNSSDAAAIEGFLQDYPGTVHATAASAALERIREDAASLLRESEYRREFDAARTDPAALREIAATARHDAYRAAAVCRLAQLEPTMGSIDMRIARCREAVDGVSSVARGRSASAMTSAQADLAGLEASRDREQAAVEAARQRAEQIEARARAQARARVSALLARARSVVSRCRQGERGAGPAADAYRAIIGAGAALDDAARARLRMDVARACACTPACAGVE